VLIARPFRSKIRISLFKESARSIYDHLDAAPVRQIDEPAKSGGIERSEFVRSEQALRVTPLFVQLDQADAVILQAIELLDVPIVNLPGRSARILAKVVRTLAWQVAGDQMLPQTALNGSFARRDISQPAAMIFRGVVRQYRRRVCGMKRGRGSGL